MLESYHILTFGCAMNEYDSMRISHVLQSRGLREVSDPYSADLVILNTCSVRGKPQHKVLSIIGQLKASCRVTCKPEKIGVMGCVAQQMGTDLLKNNKSIDFVVGTDGIFSLDSIISRVENGERVACTDWDEDVFSIAPFGRRLSHHALVTVMKGCNNYCSYCIVPYVRGREKSRDPKEIIEEVILAVENGAVEITLLGQNVNSYGLNCDFNMDFPKLLQNIANIKGIKRLRFITSHPKDFNRAMAEVMRDNKVICPFLHLPLQSGSDRILKMMNRKYTFAEYMDKINLAKDIVPNIKFSSDFIVGFPSETEEDFIHTLNAVKNIKYENIFVFNYSVRPGTKACEYKDDIPLDVKTKRLQLMNDVQQGIINENFSHLVGSKVNVLVECEKDGFYQSRTVYNRIVNFKSSKELRPGDDADVFITEAKKNSLFGEC